jgi:hypothetical protein
MTTDRELLEMALEALEEVCNANILGLEFKPQYHQLITALRTALSRKALDDLAEIDRELGLDDMQPDLAKVGEVGVWGEPVIDKSAAKRIAIQLGWEPKREWHGLTDDEIDEIIGYVDPHCQEEQFARAIEAKLKEKNQ